MYEKTSLPSPNDIPYFSKAPIVILLCEYVLGAGVFVPYLVKSSNIFGYYR